MIRIRFIPTSKYYSQLRLFQKHQSLGTFVSKHYSPDPQNIVSLLRNSGAEYRMNSKGEFEVIECLGSCSRQNRMQHDNQWKFLVRRDGSYYCYRCTAAGSWFDLKNRVLSLNLPPSGNKEDDKILDSKVNFDGLLNKVSTTPTLPDQAAAFGHTAELFPPLGVARSDKAQQVLQYLLEVRGLSEAVLRRYGVGCGVQSFPVGGKAALAWKDQLGITFPWIVALPDSAANDECDSEQLPRPTVSEMN